MLLLIAPAFCSPSAFAQGSASDPILRQSDWSLGDYQASPSAIQDTKPGLPFRGIELDGTERVGGYHGFQIAGNPFESPWRGTQTHNSVWLNTGAVGQWEMDLVLQIDGPSWPIGRTYNSRQNHTGLVATGLHTSNGYQGKNWFQMAQPEIVLATDPDDSKNTLYLVHGADRYSEFKKLATGSNTFVGTNGSTGVFERIPVAGGEPELWRLTDTHGTVYTFFGFAGAGSEAGLLWKVVDPSARTAYVGDPSTASAARILGYENGRIKLAVDGSGRRFSFTYSPASIGGTKRLVQVIAEEYENPTYTEVARVDYEYDTGPNSIEQGNLIRVITTRPLSFLGENQVRETYYQYYTGSSLLKYVLDADACRSVDWADDSNFNGSYDTLADGNGPGQIGEVASAYWEYDANDLATLAVIGGNCGCSGNTAEGSFDYAYLENPTWTGASGYQTGWKQRCVITKPLGGEMVQYFDEVGQCLHAIERAMHGSSLHDWATAIERDGNGCLTRVATPEANSSYDHTGSSMGSLAQATSVGLVQWYGRIASGPEKGFLHTVKSSEGTGGAPFLDNHQAYELRTRQIGGAYLHRSMVSESWQYPSKSLSQTLSLGSSGGGQMVSHAYTWHTGTFLPQIIVTTFPAVSTAHNGSGNTDTRGEFYNIFGELVWGRDTEGVLTYHEYDAFGRETLRIQDADTNQVAAPVPTGWGTTNASYHRATTRTYPDPSGEAREVGPTNRGQQSWITLLGDRRSVTLRARFAVVGAGEVFGLTSVRVANAAGYDEASGTLPTYGLTSLNPDLLVNSSATDALASLVTVAPSRWETKGYAQGGSQLAWRRDYFDIPIPTASPGTDGTNYDQTSYFYDDEGRQVWMEEASGTVQWDVYDGKGRITERWVGTNATGATGSSPAGFGDMTMTDAYEYDSGNPSGNGFLTKEIQRVDSTSTGQLVTEHRYDFRGQRIGSFHPAAPHSAMSLDNLGRTIESATYATQSDWNAALGQASLPASGRLDYYQTEYDARGQVYQSVRHAIDSSGVSTDSLTAKDVVRRQRALDQTSRCHLEQDPV